jgi:hypothetical protein
MHVQLERSIGGNMDTGKDFGFFAHAEIREFLTRILADALHWSPQVRQHLATRVCPQTTIGIVSAREIQNLFRSISTLCPARLSWPP